MNVRKCREYHGWGRANPIQSCVEVVSNLDTCLAGQRRRDTLTCRLAVWERGSVVTFRPAWMAKENWSDPAVPNPKLYWHHPDSKYHQHVHSPQATTLYPDSRGPPSTESPHEGTEPGGGNFRDDESMRSSGARCNMLASHWKLQRINEATRGNATYTNTGIVKKTLSAALLEVPISRRRLLSKQHDGSGGIA